MSWVPVSTTALASRVSLTRAGGGVPWTQPGARNAVCGPVEVRAATSRASTLGQAYSVLAGPVIGIEPEPYAPTELKLLTWMAVRRPSRFAPSRTRTTAGER